MIWKDIKGYEGLYQASDEGFIRRLYKTSPPKILKGRNGLDYYTVSLSKNGEKISHSVHRLVAETFLEKPEGKTEINHKDGNKLNNNINNLEWVTQRENLIHANDVIGRPAFGKPARRVKCYDPLTGEFVREFRSVADASRFYGKISARTPITFACQGLQQTAYGLKWEYAD